jgi:ABC-type sugar transport system permease subunit
MINRLKRIQITYKQEKILFGILFLSPWIIGLSFLFFGAMVDSILYSFSRVYFLGRGASDQAIQSFITSLNNIAFQRGPLVLEWIGLGNYRYALFEHPTFNRILVESIIEIVTNLPIIIIFSLLIAVMLNTKFKGNVFAKAVFFLPVIIASDAINVALSQAQLLQETLNTNASLFGNFEFRQFLVDSGLNETAVSILSQAVNQIFTIISYSGVQILIFLAGLQSIPRHLYEAADIEGATPYESFWKITIPMISPHILTVGIYTIVDSFVRAPITNLILLLIDNLQYGYSASMAWIYFATVMIIMGIFFGLVNRMVFYYDR